MPTYEYQCDACGAEFELFQSITAKPINKCPKCSKRRVRRLIGAGAGIIFKGNGFYQTDYRSDSYHKDAKKEQSATKPEKDSAKGKSDSAKPSDKNKKTN